MIGVPDPILGHAVKAFVVLETGSDLARAPAAEGMPEPPRELHGAEVHRHRAVAAEDRHRQDPQDRPAMNARFMDVELLVERGVLVPREETELLGSTRTANSLTGRVRASSTCAAARATWPAPSPRACPRARVWASDLTDACVSLARRNASSRASRTASRCVQGDLFCRTERPRRHHRPDRLQPALHLAGQARRRARRAARERAARGVRRRPLRPEHPPARGARKRCRSSSPAAGCCSRSASARSAR